MRAANSWVKSEMPGTASKRSALITACILAVFMALTSTATAEPGDAAAVTQARKDYAEAMKGHDIGLQNAMRVELAAQLAKARERTAMAKSKRPASAAAQQQNTKAPAS